MFLFPIVLIHGYTDIPVLTGSWKLAERYLSEMGVEFFTPHIPPHGSINERSISLIRQMASRYRGRSIHLFGHSMASTTLLHQFRYSHVTSRAELMLEILPQGQ